MLNKKGFTLAEVLITLGILGIVAALTIPSILTNIEKNSYTNGLRIARRNLLTGFEQMMAIEQVQALDGTTLWSKYVDDTVNTPNQNIKNELSKYFQIDKMESTALPANLTVADIHNKSTNLLDDSIRFKFINSSTINVVFYPVTSTKKDRATCDNIKNSGGGMCNYVANIFVDVNGDKKPNIIGRDIYNFYLTNEGRLYPFGGKDLNLYDSNFATWNSTCNTVEKQLNSECDARALTARVLEEGYEIKYF